MRTAFPVAIAIVLPLALSAPTAAAADQQQATPHDARTQARSALQEWIIGSPGEERPLDRFVRSLIAAKGSKWEYKVLALKSDPVMESLLPAIAERTLNALGEESWEVCGMTSETNAEGGKKVTFILKRKK